LALQTEESPYDVIGGAYPKKCITWEKIKMAVDRGVAEENPANLEDFVGDFVFNPVMEPGESSKSIKLDEPAEVLELGTGFMMVRRETFVNFVKEYPEIMYKPDHVRTAEFDGTRRIGQYFQAEVDRYNPAKEYEAILARIANGETIDPTSIKTIMEDAKAKQDASSERYLSEDYWFCQLVRKIGMKIWLCPWMHLQHAGFYTFGGKLAALASIGASATADPSQLEAMKKKK
jgi:hypothetical protein